MTRAGRGRLARAAGLAAVLAALLAGRPAVAQPRPPEVGHGPSTQAEELTERAAKLHAEGKTAEAIPLLERALALRERALGPKHIDVGGSLRNLADLRMLSGDVERAEPLYRRALAITEQTVGGDDPSLVWVLIHMAAIRQQKGDRAAAIGLLERAVAICEKRLEPTHPDLVSALDSLGGAHRVAGAWDKAIPLYERAHAIREKALGPDHPIVAGSLLALADVYQDKGDYPRAEALAERALAVLEKALGPADLAVASAQNHLGTICLTRAEHARARALFVRALATREKSLGADHPDVAVSLNNLAELDLTTGDYAAAEPLYARALAILEKVRGADDPEVATLLNNVASLQHARGNYDRAIPLLQRALAIQEKAFGKDSPQVVIALGNLAEMHLMKSDLGAAEPLLVRALSIRERALGAEHPLVAVALHNLAALYAERGDYARAEPLLQRSIAIREKALGPEHPEFAQALANLASLYDDRGDRKRALELYGRALAIQEKSLGATHPIVGITRYNLAILHERRGDIPAAIEAYQRANEIAETNLALIVATGSEQEKLAYLDTLRALTDSTLSFHARLAPESRDAARLALTTVLRRKGRVLDAMTTGVAALRSRLAPGDRALLDELAAARGDLAAFLLRKTDGDVAGRERRVAELTKKTEELEARISARSAEFRALSQPVTLEAVQRVLPEGEALVEIASYLPFDAKAARTDRWGASRYIAYVVRSAGDPTSIDLGAAAPINADVAALRGALADPRSRRTKELGRSLDEKVMRPIRRLLGGARTVLFSPQGELGLVPIAALVDEDGRYVLERSSVTYVGSGRDLLRRAARGASRQSAIVFADPAFDEEPATPGGGASDRGTVLRVRFPPLPGTASEAIELSHVLHGATIVTGKQATKAALAAVHGPAILHVATHGFFLGRETQAPAGTRSFIVESDDPVAPRGVPIENPLLRSGLALAGANAKGSTDGVLTALEASGLDLFGTKLVVLSACETGVGESQSDGLYGLRRALVVAGAETAVMSLWKVADQPTRDLMAAYYRRLEAGEGRGEGLRQVQLAMLANEKTAHPFYWASFIVSGDAGRLVDAEGARSSPKVAPGARGCSCDSVGRASGRGAALWLALGLAFAVRARRSARIS